MPKSKEFISSDSESGSRSGSPQPKKKKKDKKPEKREREKEDKGASASGSSEPEGAIVQLGKMKYATVSEFRGKVYVGIREYYDKDGKMLPGRKGIALGREEWRTLKKNIDKIDEAVRDLE